MASDSKEIWLYIVAVLGLIAGWALNKLYEANKKSTKTEEGEEYHGKDRRACVATEVHELCRSTTLSRLTSMEVSISELRDEFHKGVDRIFEKLDKLSEGKK